MQETELAALFTRLLTGRITLTRVLDSKKITLIFQKLLKKYPYQELWDAIYFSQEDDFWSTVILDINKFCKHITTLTLKGRSHRCPSPEVPVVPAKLEAKSLLQQYREQQRCRTA